MNIVDEYKDQILAYLMQLCNNHLNLPHPIHCKTHKKTNNLYQKKSCSSSLANVNICSITNFSSDNLIVDINSEKCSIA